MGGSRQRDEYLFLLLFSDDYFLTIMNIESWLSRLLDTDTCDLNVRSSL